MAENKFVVKTISCLRDEPKVLTITDFATKKEAEEFRDLTLYAMKLNYGENQTAIKVELEEL